MKKNVVKVLKFVVKYVLPIVIGWLEGDTHIVASSLCDLF